jgi:hypothetical protein
MRAWTVDADDIRVAEDFNESLLHRTPEIEGFLRSDRDDKFIVIGTKGFGKTLLLKAKCILYQHEWRATCLPAPAPLDKPIGDKIFSRELVACLIVSPLPRRRLDQREAAWSGAYSRSQVERFCTPSGSGRGSCPGRTVAGYTSVTSASITSSSAVMTIPLVSGPR